jgi:endonuclease YncB( thermonuclease family)
MSTQNIWRALRGLLPVGALLVSFFAVSTAQAVGTGGTVTRVVDGDTVDVALENGPIERVRLIGIDTPETVDPRTPVQCFGHEASAHAKELLDGQTVFLETDPSQGDRDRYGRLLAYIWLLDGRDFGEAMIADGFAHEYTYALPYAHQDAYRAAQDSAISAQAGLWSADTCAGDTEQPAVPFVADPAPSDQAASPPVQPPSPAPVPQIEQPQPAQDAGGLCGAPPNPWSYTYCGGQTIKSPPANLCSIFACITSFWNQTRGYVMQCRDGLLSHSGGIRGSCSYHGGNSRPLYAP